MGVIWVDWTGRAWTTDDEGYPDERVPELDEEEER